MGDKRLFLGSGSKERPIEARGDAAAAPRSLRAGFTAGRRGAARGSPPSGATALSHQAIRAGLFLLALGPVIILLVMMGLFTLLSPTFLTVDNLSALGAASAMTCALALGQLIVIVSGGIDLSQGSAIALATVLGAKFATTVSGSAPLVILEIVAVGALVGLLNGVIVEYLRIGSSFVVTLAMLSICSSLAYVFSGGATIVGMPRVIDVLGASYVAKIPVSAFVVVGFAVLVYGLSRRVRWGRWLFATGGNRPGAARLGIPTRRVVVGAFLVSGIAVGVASVLVAGYTNSGYPTAGALAELDAISAVVIGGASLQGGRGTVSGALVGALILGALHNGLNLLSIDPNWQPFAVGVVLIVAVGLDNVRRRLEQRLRVAESADVGMSPSTELPQDSAEAARGAFRPGALAHLAARPTPAAPHSPDERAPVLEVRAVSKRYGAVTALLDVSLDLYQGEVLALLGDNGAGKSTLIKCLTGAQTFDQGEVLVHGKAAGIRSPEDGRRLGIEAVYQDLALFDNLNLTENFFVGRELAAPDRLGALAVLRRSKMSAAVRAALASLEVRIKDPTAVVGVMSGGQRQAIAVARAVAFASRIVILDEPTAALGIRETANVLRLIRALAAGGISVIVISHNLEQVTEVANRAVVLRQGRKIGECRPTPENHDRIVSMIVGASS